MITSLRLALLTLSITVLLATARAQDPVKTELVVGNPMIAGTGPYTITIKGTLSLSKDEKGFVGTSAQITRKTIGGGTNNAAVNLPGGPPAPGMAAKDVIYTWQVPNKGTYSGTAEMLYTNSKGEITKLQSPIAQFEIK